MSAAYKAFPLRAVRSVAVIAGFHAALFSSAAMADAIDGEWCRSGRSFKIDGPDIVTYGGTRMVGEYDRHGFRYTVPASEPEAGALIIMVLRGEERLHLFKQPKEAAGHDEAPETWHRCRVTS